MTSHRRLPLHLPSHHRRTVGGSGGPGYFHKRANLDRPHDAGLRSWDPGQFNGPLMTPDIGSREAPGVRKRLRMQRNKEAYCYVDPDYLASLPRPPDHIQIQFDEVFGSRVKDADGRIRLKLALHPHLKRWAMYELHLDPKKGEAGTLWKCVWICQHEPQPGVLPVDFRGDAYLAHFTGLIGEYKEPERWEFEQISETDKKLHGVDGVEAYFHRADVREEQNIESQWEQKTHDFLSYYFNQAVDDANQAEGSGQHMRSCDMTAGYKTDERLFRQTQRNGYRIIEKRTKQDWLEQRAREAEELAAEVARAAEAERGLQTLKRRSEPERAVERAALELDQRIHEREQQAALLRLQRELELKGG